MPLEVTTGPPAVAAGAGPPGVSGLTGTPAATVNPAALFAALLTQQAQTTPAILPKATRDAPNGDATPEKTKDENQDDAEAQQPSAQGDTSQTPINWAALAALQTLLIPTQNTPVTAETLVSSVPTIQKEVMDTASLSVPAAPAAKVDTPSSGLLPLSAAPQATALDTAGPSGVDDTGAGHTASAASASRTAAPEMPVRVAPVAVTTATVSLLTTQDTTARPRLMDSILTEHAAAPVVASPALPAAVTAQIEPSAAVTTEAAGSAAVTPTAETQAVRANQSDDRAAGTTLVGPPVHISDQIWLAQPPVPVSGGQSLNISMLTAPVAMPTMSLVSGVKPLPMGVKAAPFRGTPQASPLALRGPLPVPALRLMPVLQSAPFPDIQAPSVPLAQIALQNGVIPANNTGKTDMALDNQTSAPLVTAGTTSAAPKPEHTPLPPMIEQVGPPATLAKGDKPAAEAAESGVSADTAQIVPGHEQAPSSDADASGDAKGGAVNPAMTLLLTQSVSAEMKAAAAAPPQKPLTDAERAQVVRQTADGIGAVRPQVAATGHGQMTLQLHPKDWGDLRVTVQMAPAPAIDGVKQTTVVAHVVASSPVVKMALEKQTADLNQALRATGLHLERLTVTVQAASAGEPSGGAGDGRNGQKNPDQWQGTQAQTSAGSGGVGAGGSSSFASYSERQNGGAFQGRSLSQTGSAGIDENETGITPASDRSSRPSRGFDQRA